MEYLSKRDNFKFSWKNYFPNFHNGFRKRLLSIDVRFPSINAKQGIGNIVNMIRKQDCISLLVDEKLKAAPNPNLPSSSPAHHHRHSPISAP